MSAIAHQLESAGIPTTLVALVRPHAEKIRPPRALWVPFELGRPIGTPENTIFQRRVIEAALDLLTRTDTPVLLDFPEEAPAEASSANPDEMWVCPVSFSNNPTDTPDTHTSRLMVEVAQLRPWYETWKRERGRTGVGLTGLDPSKLAQFLGSFADGEKVSSPLETGRFADAFKLAVNDLLTFYQEAANAQPGKIGSSAELNSWFWSSTEAAKTLLAIRNQGGNGDPQLDVVLKRLIVPHVAEGVAVPEHRLASTSND